MIDLAKFHRFSISVQDFENAAKYLAEAKEHQYGSLVHEALVFSAIICYFRPFTRNENDPKSAAASKLELSDFQPLSPSELELHKVCEQLRNKALAHSEISHHPTSLDLETGVVRSAIFSIVGRAPDLGALAQFIEKLRRQCQTTRANYVHHVRKAP